MDAARFDRLTVTFARSGTRRSILALLSAVSLTRLAAAETHAQACLADGQRCDAMAVATDCCSGFCRKRRHRRRGKCAPCPNACCNDTQCGSGLHCCGGSCIQCCAQSHCQVIDPKLRCCGGGCVECCDVGQCPSGQECSGDVCGTPPACATAGDSCTPDGQNANCCSGECNSGACGLSNAGEGCSSNGSCEAGLVCRGFVCTT